MFTGGSEWIIILLVVLVLFGAAAIPKLAKSLGQARKEFKKGMQEGEKEAEGQKSDGKEKPSE